MESRIVLNEFNPRPRYRNYYVRPYQRRPNHRTEITFSPRNTKRRLTCLSRSQPLLCTVTGREQELLVTEILTKVESVQFSK